MTFGWRNMIEMPIQIHLKLTHETIDVTMGTDQRPTCHHFLNHNQRGLVEKLFVLFISAHISYLFKRIHISVI